LIFEYYHCSSSRFEPETGHCRTKTINRHKDKAFSSLNLVHGAEEILRKYRGVQRQRYATTNNLNKALRSGLKQICRVLGLEGVTLYWARHSFATIARNKAGHSKDDVADALNHIDTGHKTTDIYIEKDWSLVDRLQMKYPN